MNKRIRKKRYKRLIDRFFTYWKNPAPPFDLAAFNNAVDILNREEKIIMGGKPKPGGKKDGRLKENKPKIKPMPMKKGK